jgi:membrane protein implicated in regulation of membrane protease activity
MNGFIRAFGGAVLTYGIVAKFGWLGLLISLPFFAALPFVCHWLKHQWRRRKSLR